MDALAPYDAHLLEVVRGYGGEGSTVADICEDSGLRVQTVSKQLFTLEQKGLVETIGTRKSKSTGTSGKVRRHKGTDTMDTLDAYKKQLLGIVRSYTGGVTVADLCADTGLRVQTVSTRMAELHRAGRVAWSERRRSASTGAAGKLWRAVAV